MMYMGYRTKAISSTVLRNWSTLLCFEMFYRGVGFLFLFPLLQYLLSFLPGLAGETYLGQSNILLIFHHPTATMLFVGVLLITGFYIYFEIVALFLYSEKGWQRSYCSVWGLGKETVRKAASLLHPKRLPVFLLLPVMMFSLFSITSGYLKNVRIPEFIMEFLEENKLLFGIFLGLILLFHLILFLYLFGFPALLLEGKSFVGSWKVSLGLLHKRKIRTAGKVAVYWMLFGLAMGLLTVVGILLLAGTTQLFCEPSQVRNQFQLHFLTLQGMWRIASGALASVFLCSVIVVCYHQRKEDLQPVGEKKPRTGKRVVARVIVVVGTLVALVFYSESEIGGRVWYPVDFPTRIVAHRAGATFGPENTVAALQQAAKDGAYMAEIDVQQLKDGTLVVLHDTNFKRTTGVDLSVWDADYETVKQMDAGSFYSNEFAGEPVPTLEAMLLASKNNIHLMIELKENGHEQNLVEETLALIDKYGMRGQCVIASMDMDLLKQTKKLAPEMPTVYISVILLSGQYDWKDIDAYSVETTSLTTEMVTQAHLQGKQVYAWTANSEETMEKILRCGADGLVTDNPLLAQYCISQANENLLMMELTDFFFPASEEIETGILAWNV